MDAKIQQNNTLLCNRNSAQSEQELAGTEYKHFFPFLFFFFLLLPFFPLEQQKLGTGTSNIQLQGNKE